MLALADAGRTLVVDYSAGMKKKIGLACALLHAPRLLVLDEPFEAVDPVSGGADPRHPAPVRRRRRHRHLLQPRDGGGGAAVHATSRSWPTADQARSARSTRCAAAASLEEVFVEVVGGRTATGEELSWL